MMAVLLVATTAAAPELTLIGAAKSNQSKEAARLVRQGADVNATDSRGYTPLMWAAAWGDNDLVTNLIKRGARINTSSTDGLTAWAIAVNNGRRALAEELMKAGANCRALDPDWDPRQAAKDPVIIGTVNRAIRLGEPLLKAAGAGDLRELKRLLDAGAPVGYVRRSHELAPTALMIAAQSGDVDAVRLLLRAGAIASDDHINGVSPVTAVGVPDTDAKREIVRLLKEKVGGPRPAVQATDADIAEILPAVLRRLLTAANALPPGSLRDRIIQPTTWLLNNANQYRGITTDYLGELTRCEQIVEHPPEKDRDIALGDVADDLNLKVEHCRVLGIGMGGKVRILVTTKQGNQPVNDWQILYLPKIFQHAPGITPGLVPGWTSPARESVEPGRYLLWAREPNSKKATEPIVISLSGQEVVPIDIAVP